METLKSHEAKGRDVEFMTAFLQSLIQDIMRAVPDYRGGVKDSQTIAVRGSHEGYHFFCRLLPSYIEDFLNILEGRSASFSGFKLDRRTARPVFLGGLTSAVLAGNEVAMKGLYAICNAFGKFRGGADDVKAEASLWDALTSEDKRLRTIDFDATDPLLVSARSAIHCVVRDLNPDTDTRCIPRPGPGAVYDNTNGKHSMRYRMHTDFQQTYFGFEDPEGWFTPPFCRAEVHGDNFVMRNYVSPRRSDLPTSRFKAVPKKWGKLRGICIEHNEVQYMQQAVRRMLYDAVSKHPLTKGRVVFDDQSINNRLAQSGSVASPSGEVQGFCTIDMSMASDLISRRLVSLLFEGTRLHDVLLALSTQAIDRVGIPGKSDERFFTDKFAPMGSALCFPIMGLVHWALIRAIIYHSARDDYRSAAEQVYVYGDDIVIPSSYYDLVTSCLPKYGMRVNGAKSYSRSLFRESCGGHYYNGLDITPVYLNYTPNSCDQRKDSTRLLSTIAKESQLRQKGFCGAAQVVREWTEQRLLPIGSHGVGWLNLLPGIDARKYGRRRYNLFLQCYEYYVPSAVTRKEDTSTLCNEEALLRWFCLRNEDSHRVTDSYDDLTIVYGWVPESALM